MGPQTNRDSKAVLSQGKLLMVKGWLERYRGLQVNKLNVAGCLENLQPVTKGNNLQPYWLLSLLKGNG